MVGKRKVYIIPTLHFGVILLFYACCHHTLDKNEEDGHISRLCLYPSPNDVLYAPALTPFSSVLI